VKLEQAIQSDKFKNSVHKASLNILYTAWWLKTITCKELKEFGLTHEQFNVLRILRGKYPQQMCVKDIASRMIEKNSNVPRIIDRLETKKLVKRTQGEADGRQTVISLTQAGNAILDSTNTKINKLMDETMCLNNQEASTLNSLLNKYVYIHVIK
jgi:DNA-binding MarR family transcriptional regulator